jgi:hypothetical protein
MPRSTIVKTVRLKPELWEYVERCAAADEISANGWLVRMIQFIRAGDPSTSSLLLLRSRRPHWADRRTEMPDEEVKPDAPEVVAEPMSEDQAQALREEPQAEEEAEEAHEEPKAE